MNLQASPKELRAWWIRYQLITDVHTIDYQGEAVNAGCAASDTNHPYDYLSNAVLLQYTGFNDKNNKKIFEGDIIKNSLGTVYLVEFWHGMFVGRESGSEYSLALYDLLEEPSFEIVGNLFENPELLKLQD